MRTGALLYLLYELNVREIDLLETPEIKEVYDNRNGDGGECRKKSGIKEFHRGIKSNSIAEVDR